MGPSTVTGLDIIMAIFVCLFWGRPAVASLEHKIAGFKYRQILAEKTEVPGMNIRVAVFTDAQPPPIVRVVSSGREVQNLLGRWLGGDWHVSGGHPTFGRAHQPFPLVALQKMGFLEGEWNPWADAHLTCRQLRARLVHEGAYPGLVQGPLPPVSWGKVYWYLQPSHPYNGGQ